MKVFSFPSYRELSVACAAEIEQLVRANPSCVLGLATGSTPIEAYSLLVKQHKENGLDFSRVSTVNLDEYCGLDRNHPQSYYTFMKQHLFDLVNLAPQALHLPRGNAENLQWECEDYEALIRSLGGVDLQLLGIGNNGHIGFNEPGEGFAPATHVVSLAQSTRLANARFFASLEEVPTQAITMGIGTILSAKKILLLCSGEQKAQALLEAVTGPVHPKMPASALQLHADATILADKAAISLLQKHAPHMVASVKA